VFKDLAIKAVEVLPIEKTVLFMAGATCKFQLEERDKFNNDHTESEEAECKLGSNQKA